MDERNIDERLLDEDVEDEEEILPYSFHNDVFFLEKGYHLVYHQRWIGVYHGL